MATRRIRMKYLNPYSFKILSNIVHYLQEKEFATLDEIWVEMRKEGWGKGLPIHSKHQLRAVLLKNLRNVITNEKYILTKRIHVNGTDKTESLFSLEPNWAEGLIDYFNLLKEKGERYGKYEGEEE